MEERRLKIFASTISIYNHFFGVEKIFTKFYIVNNYQEMMTIKRFDGIYIYTENLD